MSVTPGDAPRAARVRPDRPDRLARDGRTTAEGLRADGVYRSRFETPRG